MLITARNQLLEAASWSATEVSGVLREFCLEHLTDIEATHVSDVLLEAGIDGATLLQLTDHEMCKLGFSQMGIRKTLTRFIRQTLSEGKSSSTHHTLDADSEQEALYIQMKEEPQDPAERELLKGQESPMAMALRARHAKQTKAVVLLQAVWRGYQVRKQHLAEHEMIRGKAEPHVSGWRTARAKVLKVPQDRWKSVLRLSGVKMQTIFSTEADSFSYKDFRPKRFIAKGEIALVFVVFGVLVSR